MNNNRIIKETVICIMHRTVTKNSHRHHFHKLVAINFKVN